jgi:mono/diheme cytochrome c family protein
MKYLIIPVLIAVMMSAAMISCTSSGAETAKQTLVDSSELVKRGEYLVTIGVCDDCHSPKKMGPKGPEIDPELRLSGYPSSRPIPKFDSNMAKTGMVQFNEDFTAYAGPWGLSFSANLTSSPTGAGSWEFDNFKYAIRHGKWKGLETSRDLMPPMPWFNYKLMPDEDLKAVHAYLKTLKPVDNVPPPPMGFQEAVSRKQ